MRRCSLQNLVELKAATQLEPEDELVNKAQTGCAESFAVLVKEYELRIYRLSYAVTGDPEVAEVILLETFLKAYANIGDFRGQSRFYTWLVHIAINEGVTKLRRRDGPNGVSLEQPADADGPISVAGDIDDWRDNPEESYGKNELRAILSKTLQDLETPLRVVFVLRDIADLSSEDAAKVLGLSVPTLTRRLMRGRLKLRDKLSVWFEEHPALAAG